MPKAALFSFLFFLSEENILNTALGVVVPGVTQITNHIILEADEPINNSGTQPCHLMDGVQQKPSLLYLLGLCGYVSRTRGQ